MIWGFLSDAHGNPLGLLTCLGELARRGAEKLFFLGDAVGYLPLENECITALDEFGVICLAGNHEAMLRGELPLDPAKNSVYGINAARARLSEHQLALIESWPYRRVLDFDNGETTLLVHGGPHDPIRQYIYADTDIAGVDAFGHRAIFVGQTHRPFVRSVGATLLVNVGSCGLPRDVVGLAACAVYDVASHDV